MPEIKYSFKQVSPTFGVEEMREDIKAFQAIKGASSYYNNPIFILENDEFILQLYLALESKHEEGSILKIFLETAKKLDEDTKKSLEVEDVSFELAKEHITVGSVKRFMVATLFDQYLI